MKRRMMKVFAVLLVAVALSGCQKSGLQEAKQTTQKFWDAVKAGDAEKVKPLVTKASAQAIQPESEGILKREGEVVIGDSKIKGDTATIETTITDKGFAIPFQTILVKEGGQWKVDADQTMASAMAGAMGAMGQALGEGMKAAGTAMEQAGKELAAEATAPTPPPTVAAPTAAPAAAPEGKVFAIGAPVKVEWKGKWWPASVIEIGQNSRWKIHYDGYDNSWDEWVGPERIQAKR